MPWVLLQGLPGCVDVVGWLVEATLLLGASVTKPTPYSNSTHFSDHFAYHITFPFVIM